MEPVRDAPADLAMLDTADAGSVADVRSDGVVGVSQRGTIDVGSAAPAAVAEHTGSPEGRAVDAPTRIANRYELGKVLGKGGFGAVYRARDLVTRADVAVKVLHERDSDELVRFRSEVSLLRLLRLPNLVHLLDDGVHKGRPFLVTELVEGNPFPGVPAPATWDEVEKPTIALLEALARVHAQGVVHRDLKPANVLVLPDATPVILDFGVSFGPGYSTDGEGMAMGTPAFLAPEQAMGRRGDARADLYAVGVMLFEALTGRLPYEAKSLSTLLRAKLTKPAVSIAELEPDLPPHVAATIDSLLRQLPKDRPASATAVLQQLGARSARLELPWLGDDALVERAVQALAAGRTVATTGRRGLGHTRLLQEAAKRWAAQERTAWSTRPSVHPWGSLPVPLRRRLGNIDADDVDAVVAALEQAAAEGVAVFVDDAPRVDAATRAAIDRARVPSLWTSRAGADVELPLAPLTPDQLRGLFHGPDLILHLREDSARLVHERTGGVPAKVASLVRAWETAGLCYRDGACWRIDREAISRLEAGLRVWTDEDEDAPHDPLDAQLLSWTALAGTTASRDVLSAILSEDVDALEARIDAMVKDGLLHEAHDGTLRAAPPLEPDAHEWHETARRAKHADVGQVAHPGAPGRLLHLVRARDEDAIAEEALRVREQAVRTGRYDMAFAALREALSFIRLTDRVADEWSLARALTLTAIEAQSARTIDLALYEVQLCRRLGERGQRLVELLDVTRLVRYKERDKVRALPAARALPTWGEDAALEKWRRAAEMVAAFGLEPDEMYAIAERHREWAEGCGDAGIAASVYGWVGIALYRLNRFEDAAAMHERAAAGAEGAAAEALAWGNAASAWLECARFEAAVAAAGRAYRLADASRTVDLAMRGLVLGRASRARAGEQLAADDEVHAVVAASERLASVSHYYDFEVQVAWHSGDRQRALALAQA